MFPKLATHILHQTSRAAAAVHGQSNYIRNLLQFQSQPSPTSANGLGGWSGPGFSGSSWGSQGAGPGGAKYHAGSRLHNGYNGAGRIVTQVGGSTVPDDSTGYSDESDEHPPKRASIRQFRRSHSLSFSGGRPRVDLSDSFRVLESVPVHAKFRHTLASNNDTRIGDLEMDLPHASVVRSDSSLVAPESLTSDVETPDVAMSFAFAALKVARDSGDKDQVLHEVRSFRAKAINPTVYEFNMALDGLHRTREEGDPLNDLLETYNDMVTRSIFPNVNTYSTLILALTQRDLEVHNAITAVEMRCKRLEIISVNDSSAPLALAKDRIATLRQESNFTSAFSLFEAAMAMGGFQRLPPAVYKKLIKSAAYRANVDAALTVFAHLEKREDIYPTANIFVDLISVYSNAKDIAGAKEVFDKFRNASREGHVSWTAMTMTPHADKEQQIASAIGEQLLVWNAMIKAYFDSGQAIDALGVLEQMMDLSTGNTFDPTAPPPPNSSTFTLIITGFCQLRDTESALSWFNRLLRPQSVADGSPQYLPLRPDQLAWSVMIEYLAREGMVEDLNRYFSALLETAVEDKLEISPLLWLFVLAANSRALETSQISSDRVFETLDPVLDRNSLRDAPADTFLLKHTSIRAALQRLLRAYLKQGHAAGALNVLERQVLCDVDHINRVKAERGAEADEFVSWKTAKVCQFICAVSHGLLDSLLRQTNPSLDDVMRVARLSDAVDLIPNRMVAPYYLHVFGLELKSGRTLDLSTRDWTLLLISAVTLEAPQHQAQQPSPVIENYAFAGTPSLVACLAHHGVQPGDISPPIMRRVILALLHIVDAAELETFLKTLGPPYETLLQTFEQDIDRFRNQDLSAILPDSSSHDIQIDMPHSRYIDQYYPPNKRVSPLDAYARFEAGLVTGSYPSPWTIGRLINFLGRLGEFEKVRRLYDVGQLVLSSMKCDKSTRSRLWFYLEDSMVMAYAHGGRPDTAHLHRQRILQLGSAPSADAYGALIQSVKNTTDDCSNALALFQEAQVKGVTPNVYLFHTIISKLSRARKADFALDLFGQMKTYGLRLTSITYGAVIAACARVGDAQSAELLFEEMTQQPNFQPRIPPYNTMIQLYTSTKPNRDRALHFYNQLRSKGLAPTSHTYKLLLDVYGTIEPIDIEAMERIFAELECNKHVPIQGPHWASLIHAYGCVRKDLDKAITTFESIHLHPRSASSSIPLPDAVTYEALITVLVTHRRTDLISSYIERLQASNVHMTAYIANLIIKGYAAADDIIKAREVFESLEDPPEGVAAPNNHAPNGNNTADSVSTCGPVYREPSTWEAMVRAELGSGNREQAVSLITRLQLRKFPPAVEHRISSIMLDDPLLPWPESHPSSPLL